MSQSSIISPPNLFYLDQIVKEIPGFVKSHQITPDPLVWCRECDCHNNTIEYIQGHPGEIIHGYFALLDASIGVYRFIRHSVIKTDKIIDITPVQFKKLYFIETNKELFDLPETLTYCDSFVGEDIISSNERGEYYVYLLENNEPFYVGKGTGNRDVSHFTERSLNSDTNLHKKRTILKGGCTSRRIYENILSEKLAYDLEEMTIRRIGLEKLTNICINANPPNHKNKSYLEIYGPVGSYVQRTKRTIKQKAAGGYGPKKFSTEVKRQLSDMRKGKRFGYAGMNEEETLSMGKIFCEYFNYKISLKKWVWFLEKNDAHVPIRSLNFSGKYILDVFVDKYNAQILYEKSRWLYNKDKNKNIRIPDWLIREDGIPEGYVMGRFNHKELI